MKFSSRLLPAAAALASLHLPAMDAAGICTSAAFQALPMAPLGSSPIQVRTLVQGASVCLEFALSSPSFTAGWFAVGLAKSSSMVNSPASNCMVYQGAVGVPESYVLGAYSRSGVAKEDDQTFFTPVTTSSSSSPLRFAYERQLAAKSPNDVAIDPNQTARFVWAYGKSWPINGHASGTMGSEKYSFATGGSVGAGSSFTSSGTGFCDDKNCSAIFGGIALAIMMVGGLVLTALAPNAALTEVLLEKTLAAPPVKSTTNVPIPDMWTSFRQGLADLRVGEALIILVFLVAAVLIRALSTETFQVTSGKIALLTLMFLILPISKVPLWSILFNSSFERIVKFHRWLGTLLVIIGFVHLLLVLPKTSLWTTTKYNNATPLFGTLSFITFLLMALTANKYMRRKFFEVFYISHRVLSIAAFVFTILHCVKTIGVGLVVPLAFYLVGLLDQWRRSYLSSYHATITANENTDTTVLMLAPGKNIAKYAQTMNLCSYFWVRVPAVSSFEWHPFSAIVTPKGDAFGFCIRAAGPDSAFTQRLHELAKVEQSVQLNLCGPFGKVGLDVTKYDTVIMIGGGVGITPLLSAVNEHKQLSSLKSLNAYWHVLWSVRRPEELLMAEQFMPSQQAAGHAIQDAFHPMEDGNVTVTWHCHCSDMKEDGAIDRQGGDPIRYRADMPVLDEYINSSRWMGRKVAILACGPPTMVVTAQALARQCGFAFHKEVFNW